MRDLYARARANLALTPGERALLKLIDGLLVAAVVAALPVVSGALGHAGVQWSEVARTALAAGTVAALLALAKYLKAHGDPALGDALIGVAANLAPASATTGATTPVAPSSQPGASLAGNVEPVNGAAGLSDAGAGDGIPEAGDIPGQLPAPQATQMAEAPV